VANGAIMRLNKNSNISNEYLQLLANSPPSEASRNSTYWGCELYLKLTKNSILLLPGVWFDPDWADEGFRTSFSKNRPFDLFDGAFTWHWHNQWDSEVDIGSKFQVLEEKHNIIFQSILDLNL